MHTCGFVVFNRLASLDHSGWSGIAGDSVQPGSAESSRGEPVPPRDALPAESSLLWLFPPFQGPDQDPDQAYFPTDEQCSPAGLICDLEGKGKKLKLSTHLCLITNEAIR